MKQINNDKEIRRCKICHQPTEWHAVIDGTDINYCFDHFKTVRKGFIYQK